MPEDSEANKGEKGGDQTILSEIVSALFLTQEARDGG